jgi:hypothetical protein
MSKRETASVSVYWIGREESTLDNMKVLNILSHQIFSFGDPVFLVTNHISHDTEIERHSFF